VKIRLREKGDGHKGRGGSGAEEAITKSETIPHTLLTGTKYIIAKTGLVKISIFDKEGKKINELNA